MFSRKLYYLSNPTARMVNINKCAPLFLVLLIVVSVVVMVKPAAAQSTLKPAIPEFSLKIVARAFDVGPSATTTVDPYTGQTAITGGGYHVENTFIDLTVKNQPSVTYYQVQFKGNYGKDWQIYSDSNTITPIQLTQYQSKSDGDHTIISIPINSNEPLNANGDHSGSVTNFPIGGQVDFQVRALIGQTEVKQAGLMGDMVIFNGETSDWSNTQTIIISTQPQASTPPPISTSPTQIPVPSTQPLEPTVTPIKPNAQSDFMFGLSGEQYLIMAMAAVIAVLVVALVLSRIRRTG